MEEDTGSYKLALFSRELEKRGGRREVLTTQPQWNCSFNFLSWGILKCSVFNIFKMHNNNFMFEFMAIWVSFWKEQVLKFSYTDMGRLKWSLTISKEEIIIWTIKHFCLNSKKTLEWDRGFNFISVACTNLTKTLEKNEKQFKVSQSGWKSSLRTKEHEVRWHWVLALLLQVTE